MDDRHFFQRGKHFWDFPWAKTLKFLLPLKTLMVHRFSFLIIKKSMLFFLIFLNMGTIGIAAKYGNHWYGSRIVLE